MGPSTSHLMTFAMLGALAIVLVGIGIALWVLLRKKKEPRGFDVITKE